MLEKVDKLLTGINAKKQRTVFIFILNTPKTISILFFVFGKLPLEVENNIQSYKVKKKKTSSSSSCI